MCLILQSFISPVFFLRSSLCPSVIFLSLVAISVVDPLSCITVSSPTAFYIDCFLFQNPHLCVPILPTACLLPRLPSFLLLCFVSLFSLVILPVDVNESALVVFDRTKITQTPFPCAYFYFTTTLLPAGFLRVLRATVDHNFFRWNIYLLL